jgi:hypothetical protein
VAGAGCRACGSGSCGAGGGQAAHRPESRAPSRLGLQSAQRAGSSQTGLDMSAASRRWLHAVRATTGDAGVQRRTPMLANRGDGGCEVMPRSGAGWVQVAGGSAAAPVTTTSLRARFGSGGPRSGGCLRALLGLSPVGCSVVCLLCHPADAASVRVRVCASSLGCCTFDPLGMWLRGTGEIPAGWSGTDAVAPEGVAIPPWRASRFPPPLSLEYRGKP